MPKLSLIDMTQDILSDMSDDEVNSISDTLESMQVAQIIKSVYYELIGNKNWPHLRQLGSLDSSTDNQRPTHMKLPELVKELEWVEYNKRTRENPARNKWEPVEFKTPDEFLRITSRYDNTKDNIKVVEDYSGVDFHIQMDRHPRIWTTFDDDFIVFDSFDCELDDTLQETHSRISVYKEPSWSMVDDFIPDLPSEAFPALLAEAKSVAFVRLKQEADAKAEQQSTRQRSWLSRKSWRVNGGIRLPNYARRSRK